MYIPQYDHTFPHKLKVLKGRFNAGLNYQGVAYGLVTGRRWNFSFRESARLWGKGTFEAVLLKQYAHLNIPSVNDSTAII